MNPEDREVERILRAHKPDPQVPPALAGRIVARLGDTRTRRVSPWIWLLPATTAAALLLLLKDISHAPPTDSRESIESVVVLPQADPPRVPRQAWDPLSRETLALGRDAERASRFLIDCLPSLPAAP